MAEGPVVVTTGNSATPVILSLIAAGLIAFALWFFLIDNNGENEVLPGVTETSLGG